MSGWVATPGRGASGDETAAAGSAEGSGLFGRLSNIAGSAMRWISTPLLAPAERDELMSESEGEEDGDEANGGPVRMELKFANEAREQTPREEVPPPPSPPPSPSPSPPPPPHPNRPRTQVSLGENA